MTRFPRTLVTSGSDATYCRSIANAVEGRLRLADRVESVQEERTLAARSLTAALVFATVTCLSGPVLAVEYMLEFEGLWDGTSSF